MSIHIDNLLTWNNRNLNIIAGVGTFLAFRLVGIFPSQLNKSVCYAVGFAIVYIYYEHQHDVFRWASKIWNSVIHIKGETRWETIVVKMLSLFFLNMTAALICFETVRDAPLLASIAQLPILLIVSVIWERNNLKIGIVSNDTKSARYVNFDGTRKY